ncbi:MAG: D-alanine--D-alanine ligase [Bacteroidales bacterium]|nr:D-alanine--D-alanine ligase [Bacteroidales bacterium]MBO7487369.1 D-alanine--D-alanine ligase [Bacteroidales bacterium]
MMKKKIAVIYGGTSSEREISILSGRYAAASIDRDRYEVYEVLFNADNWLLVEWESADSERMKVLGTVDKGTFSCNGVKFDVACIMIHGIPGENGLLQGYFEMMGVPVTTCSSFVCTVAFNKYSCKAFLRDTGVRMADDVFLHRGEPYDVDEIVGKLSLPVFVKPSDGGSSFGVTKVKKASDIPAAIAAAFKESDTILIEKAITGREMTQAAYTSKGKVVLLPVTEIITQNEYFDYEAKYLGKSDEVCPAGITAEQKADIGFWTETLYRHLGCTGLMRMDYIMAEDGVYFLEINATPGMTRMSLVPKMLRAARIDIKEFYTELIESAR